MNQTKRSLKISALFYLKLLGVQLCTVDGALWEVVRNGVCACMPDDDKWIPGCGQIEINLVEWFPLVVQTRNSKTLIVLDHGSGFTERSLELFHQVGRLVDQNGHRKFGTANSGASEKGIGRFAAFALNKFAMSEEEQVCIKSCFFVLTRTGQSGPIRMLSVLPLSLQDGSFPEEFISEADSRLGHLSGIKGSFSAIVIPDSILETKQEIIEAIKWHLPRKRDFMFNLKIGGQEITPPPLASQCMFRSEDASIEANLEVAGDEREGGIWLVDKDTGLRVASLADLGQRVGVPFPFHKTEITGDIFAADVLRYQNTARNSLDPSFISPRTNHPKWRKIKLFLTRHAEKAKALLGEIDGEENEEGIGSEELRSVAELFELVFGKAEEAESAIIFDLEEALRKKRKKQKPIIIKPGIGDGDGHKPDPDELDEGNKDPKKKIVRAMMMKIGDDSYQLVSDDLDMHIYAQIDQDRQDVIRVNVRRYTLMPSRKDARFEHVLNQLLLAVAVSKNAGDAYGAHEMVGKLRFELQKYKK
ncbi:MAG: hypothetical protein Q7S34_02110 [bacterium]|nr:hypothetical protein [bacterium]